MQKDNTNSTIFSSQIRQGVGLSKHNFKRTEPLYTYSEFEKKPLEWRIHAILSDGQYYTISKIARIVRSDDAKTSKIMLKMLKNGEIIASKSGESYRMSFEKLAKWRKNNNIELTQQIVPNILYPRIVHFHGKTMTEQEIFLNCPRHIAGNVKFTVKNENVIRKLKAEYGFLGHFINIEPPYKYMIVCLSADWVKNKLQQFNKSQGGNQFVGSISVYNVSVIRDLVELDPMALEQIARFYQTFQTYSQGAEPRPAIMSPAAYKTLKLYLDDDTVTPGLFNSGVMTQLNKWILDAIQHYDENCGSPFAAYLQMIVNRRVNDIPQTILGENLAKYQNLRDKAIKSIDKREEYKGNWHSLEDIYAELEKINPEYTQNVDFSTFCAYDEDFKAWQSKRHNATSELTWSETSSEKQFEEQHSTYAENQETKHNVQKAIIDSAVESGSVKDGKILLYALQQYYDTSNEMALAQCAQMLSDKAKIALAQMLRKG